MKTKNIILPLNGSTQSYYEFQGFKIPVEAGGAQKNIVYELEILKNDFNTYLLMVGIDDVGEAKETNGVKLLALSKPYGKNAEINNLIYSLFSKNPFGVEGLNLNETTFIVHGKFVFALIVKLFKPKSKVYLYVEGIFSKLVWSQYIENYLAKILYCILSFFSLFIVDKVIVENKRSFLLNSPIKHLIKEMIYIPNAVDGSVFKPIKQKLNKEMKTLLYVGRLEQKNPGLLFEAFSLVVMKRDDVELLIITARKALVDKYIKLFPHIKDKVKYIEQAIPNESLPEYYNNADLLLLTSKHEGTPYAVLESLSCGIPCVITDVVDPGIVVDEINGYTSKTFSPKDFSHMILKGLELSLKIKPKCLSLLTSEHDLENKKSYIAKAVDL